MRGKLVLLGLTLTIAMGLPAPAASALILHPPPPTSDENFTCRASALRVSALNGVLFSEPVVANRANNPCRDEKASALTANVPGFAQAGALNAETDNEARGATSKASVANVTLTLGGRTINATVLSSQAAVTCSGGFHPGPQFSGSSSLATLTVDGKSYTVGDQSQTIQIPQNDGSVLTIAINEQVREQNRITQRALRVTLAPGTPLATEVVVAESIANVRGNPCD